MMQIESPTDTAALLSRAADAARRYLDSLPERPVRAAASGDELRTRFAVPLRDEGRDPGEVLDALVRAAEPGLVASAGPRYFGFVIGGTHPVAIAADWLTAAWDQHGGFFSSSPACSVSEDAVIAWLIDLFGLPKDASGSLVTGCQTANVTALAAARNAMLARLGWDVEQQGLAGAPAVELVAGGESHVSIYAALRLLGFGVQRVHVAAADAQGRMRPEALEETLSWLEAPAIVCAQAGNVNSGAFDPLDEIGRIVRRHNGWLHVDGAFGLWAAASPRTAPLIRGLALADSWASDAHKWLNVPYDCGLVFVRDRRAHHAAMTLTASYLQQTDGRERDGLDWVPEASRRARAFVLWATLQTLGRAGVAELVDRCCDCARLFAARLAAVPGITIANDVVLNQVLVRLAPPAGRDAVELTRAVAARIQRDGVCWLGSTIWQGGPALRVSVSSWMTTPQDVERSVEAIVSAYRAEEAA